MFPRFEVNGKRDALLRTAREGNIGARGNEAKFLNGLNPDYVIREKCVLFFLRQPPDNMGRKNAGGPSQKKSSGDRRRGAASRREHMLDDMFRPESAVDAPDEQGEDDEETGKHESMKSAQTY